MKNKEKTSTKNNKNFIPDPELIELSCGAKLVVAKNNKQNFTQVVAGYNSGASDESKNTYGISHLIEHLMFARIENERLKNSDFLDEVVKSSNAYTSPDYLYSTFAFKSNDIDKVLPHKLDEVINIQIPEQDRIDKEIKIICEEAALNNEEYEGDNEELDEQTEDINSEFVLNSKIEYLEDNQNNKLFDDVYGFSVDELNDYDVLGYKSGTVQKLKQIDLLKHVRKYYHPGNLIVSVVTNLPVNEIKKYVEEAIERYEKNYVPTGITEIDGIIPKINSPRVINGVVPKSKNYINFDDKNKCINLEMCIPYNPNLISIVDYNICNYLESYLMNNDGGFLFDEVRTKNQMAYNACLNNIKLVTYDSNICFKHFEVQTSNPEYIPEITKIMANCINRLCSNSFITDRQFEKFRNYYLTHLTKNENSLASSVDNFFSLIYTSQPDFKIYGKVVNRLKTITKQEAHTLLRKIYYDKELYVIVNSPYELKSILKTDYLKSVAYPKYKFPKTKSQFEKIKTKTYKPTNEELWAYKLNDAIFDYLAYTAMLNGSVNDLEIRDRIHETLINTTIIASNLIAENQKSKTEILSEYETYLQQDLSKRKIEIVREELNKLKEEYNNLISNINEKGFDNKSYIINSKSNEDEKIR